MNLAHLLARAARAYPDHPAIATGTGAGIAYRDLADRVGCLAAGMTARFGLSPGERIAIVMRNCPEFYEILFAVWHAGLAAVPINAKLHRREFAYMLDHSGARLCFASPDLAETTAPLANEVAGLDTVITTDSRDYTGLAADMPAPIRDAAPGDLAWLFYTSGTTGRPKGAMLSHGVLLAMTMGYFADIDALDTEDCIIHAAPLSHGSGLYGLPHFAKGANNIIPESGGFDEDEIFDLIAARPNATFFFAPTMITRLINHRRAAEADTDNLKTIVYGGGPMYVEDSKKALDLFGPKLVQIFGQGEAPMTISYLSKAMHADIHHPRHLARLASAGIERTDVEIRILDADDKPMAVDEVGEIAVRGGVVMPGYWRNPEATAETLRGGWLHSGDLGSLDADGFLTIKGRSKDMIISGGSNIYPREVEDVLLLHDGVVEASVIGRAHPEWGEEVVAYIVTRPDSRVDPAALDRLCIENIARFKRPRAYFTVDSLPKNNYGKVLKTELRERLGTGAETAPRGDSGENP